MEAPTSELSTETPHVNVNAQLVNHTTSIKLPKLVLPKFRGDITSYRTFWESFESAVHKNVYLSNIDKFNYLLSLLERNLIVEKTDVVSLHPWDKDGDESLTSAVKRFWDTESLAIFEPKAAPEQQFPRELKFDENQHRYQVHLPWKDDRVPENNGYVSCLKRLRQLHTCLKTDRELLKQYDNVIKEQVESGIIEQVLENSASDESIYFLPHHGVIREDKTTTKVCVVFDGSAKHGTSNLSLNECLEKGPNLVPHLFDVVIRFRSYPVGIVAEIEKAFHQIEINHDDRRMLRFLWFDDIYTRNTLKLSNISFVIWYLA